MSFAVEECPTAEEAKKIIYQFDYSWTDKYCGAHKTLYFPQHFIRKY